MKQPGGMQIRKSAQRLLAMLANAPSSESRTMNSGRGQEDVAVLIASDLAIRVHGGRLQATAAGRAYLARINNTQHDILVDPFRGQHLELARRDASGAGGHSAVIVDEAESPLGWLARRKGRDGKALIEPHQLLAGERLRAEFTRAQLMPRTTSNWEASVAHDRRGGGGAASFADAVVNARQNLREALKIVGPEFAGLLLDVCCFLKGLEDVERERLWPPRSAKVVLQLALERLARHYGYAAEARGRADTSTRIWLAPDAVFTSGD